MKSIPLLRRLSARTHLALGLAAITVCALLSATYVGLVPDAEAMARLIRAHGLPALVLDTANRPTPWLEALSRHMDATFLPLPRAEAHRLSAALSAALGG